MARETSDREDLLREATALVERIEIALPGESEPVVMGFRRDGSWSVFFGAEPVYQFTSAGALRRAYAGERLIKAEQGRLVALRRERTAEASLLVRHELTESETSDFLAAASKRLATLCNALMANEFRRVGQVPEDGQVAERSLGFLAKLADPPQIASRPNAE